MSSASAAEKTISLYAAKHRLHTSMKVAAAKQRPHTSMRVAAAHGSPSTTGAFFDFIVPSIHTRWLLEHTVQFPGAKGSWSHRTPQCLFLEDALAFLTGQLEWSKHPLNRGFLYRTESLRERHDLICFVDQIYHISKLFTLIFAMWLIFTMSMNSSLFSADGLFSPCQ